jgi:hypothetical protein
MTDALPDLLELAVAAIQLIRAEPLAGLLLAALFSAGTIFALLMRKFRDTGAGGSKLF